MELRHARFMVCDGRWKLMFGQSAEAPAFDGLYDLQADPQEVSEPHRPQPGVGETSPEKPSG